MVEIFAFLVIAGVVMVLVMPIIPGIQQKRAIRKFEEYEEREREEVYRKAQHNNYLKEQAKKLTSGYAVRSDGRIKKIPNKYHRVLNAKSSLYSLPGDGFLLLEFHKDYPYYKI
jgi:heme exporter protein D